MRNPVWAVGLVLALGLLVACGDDAPATATDPVVTGEPGKADGLGGSCPEFGKPVLVGEIDVDGFAEVSGAAASRRTPSVLWAHEDHGNGERLVAVTRTGDRVAEVDLPLVEQEDFEDLALVPGGDEGDLLVIADIGDKGLKRSSVVLYSLPEPALDPDLRGGVSTEWTKVARHELTWGDGEAHHAQAMVVEPRSGDVYVITSRGGADAKTAVYRAQAPLATAQVLERVLDEDDVPALDARIVGADAVADRLALLTDEGQVLLWAWPAGSTMARALKGRPCQGPKVAGTHGAVALSADGGSYTLIPEGGRPDILFVEPKQRCPEAADPDELGEVDGRSVREISGAVVSRVYEDVLWAHNDGAEPLLLAFDFSGDLVAKIEIEGLELEDWEDLATGPDDDGNDALWLGDLGDNALARDTVRVVRLPEPDLTVDEPTVDLSRVSIFELAYDDGDAHDAEGLSVDPISGDLYVVTKAQSGDARTQVFVARAPLREGEVLKLHQVLTDRYAPHLVGSVTALDISPLGDRVIAAFKGEDARLWPRDPARPLWEAFQRKGCAMPGGKGQVESIAFGEDGVGYFMVPEGKDPPVLWVELE